MTIGLVQVELPPLANSGPSSIGGSCPCRSARARTAGHMLEGRACADDRGGAAATKQLIKKMPREWNAFWYWRDRPVKERVNAANVLEAAGVEIAELASRDEREQPPDCEAKLDGQFSGIEVTELVHRTARRSIKARRERAAGKAPKRPEVLFVWDRSSLLSVLRDRLDRKQWRWQGGPYQRRVLVMYTDEFLLDRVRVGGFLQDATFQSGFFTDVFLGLSYHDGCFPVFHFAESDGTGTLKLQPSLFVARYDVYPFEGPMVEEYPSRDSMIQLILKRAPIGPNREDYDVLAEGEVVCRIFLSPAAPQERPWMWASSHNGDIRRATHGYEATREAAMTAFAKSWRRE